MVHNDFGWTCPQCGSSIIDPAKKDEPRAQAPQQQQQRLATAGSKPRG
jgi:hypothetical protein